MGVSGWEWVSSCNRCRNQVDKENSWWATRAQWALSSSHRKSRAIVAPLVTAIFPQWFIFCTMVIAQNANCGVELLLWSFTSIINEAWMMRSDRDKDDIFLETLAPRSIAEHSQKYQDRTRVQKGKLGCVQHQDYCWTELYHTEPREATN